MGAPGLALLRQHYPDALRHELAAICQALGDLALPLELLSGFLSRYGKHVFRHPAALLAELYLSPPYEVFAAGAEKSDVVFRLHNLGRIFQDYAQLEKAYQIFTLALEIDRQRYGDSHPRIATDLNKLGTVLHDQGQLSAARDAFAQALIIDELQLGPNHLNVARDSNNLAILMQDGGDLTSAYAGFSRAYGICEQALGAEHSYSLIVQQHLVQLEMMRV